MQTYKGVFANWSIVVLAVFIMLFGPVLIADLHETANTFKLDNPSKALVITFLSFCLKLITGFVWTLFLLFVADNVPRFAGWGLETTSRERRSLNTILFAIGGFAITDTLTQLAIWVF